MYIYIYILYIWSSSEDSEWDGNRQRARSYLRDYRVNENDTNKHVKHYPLIVPNHILQG